MNAYICTKRDLKSLCIDEVPDLYLCSICEDVLVKPHQCKEGHMYCYNCIDNWLKEEEYCPVCIQGMTKAELAKCLVLDNLVGQLKVRCEHNVASIDENMPPPKKRSKTSKKGGREWEESKTNTDDENDHSSGPNPSSKKRKKGAASTDKQKGCENNYCDWQGLLCELDHHLESDCSFIPTRCPYAKNGCRLKIQLRNVDSHAETCPYQHVVCQVCNRNGICLGDMTDHLEVCEMVLVNCKNGCPESHLRCDTHAHEAVCPEALIICPFVRHGCNDIKEMTRRENDVHQMEAATYHSNIVAETLTKLDKEMTLTSQTLLDLKASMNIDQVQMQQMLLDLIELRNDSDRNRMLGELNIKWKVKVGSITDTRAKSFTSEKFQINVPCIGVYRCYLTLKLLEEQVAIYIHVPEGPMFPADVVLAEFRCHDVSKRLFDVSIDSELGKGISNFMSRNHAILYQTEGRYLTIRAHIKIAGWSVLSLKTQSDEVRFES